ncbi:MAG: hypothetical protein K5641_04220, partial [Lachnospiraceae bacterium]|nr:hypothetical protein [Lachnospiraceae bacterium]
SIATGGGGGSSYLLYEGKKILSAAGGGSATMTLKRHELRTQYGASGGGSSLIENAGDLTWMTDDVKVMESGKNKGNGKIIFKLVRPRIGMELHQDHDDWTKDEVTVRAEITSTGEGVEEDCFFWEYEPKGDADEATPEGAPLGEWTGEDSIMVHTNGTVTCKVRDVNGNEEEAVLKVTNIDRKGPRISPEFSPRDWTMDPVTLTIKASDEDGCGLADEGYLWSDDTEILPDDEGDYELQWNSVTSKIYEENTSVTVAVRDKLGNRTEKTIRITNIDRTAPTVHLVPEGKWTSGEMTFTIEASDLQPDGETEGSGLSEEAYSVDGENYTNERTILVKEPGTVTVWVRDQLGNLTESHISVAYDKPKNEGGKSDDGKSGSGKGGKGGKSSGSGEGAGKNEGETSPAGEGTIPAAEEVPVEIPGIDTTSALGNINLNAAKEALQTGRKAKRRSESGAEDAMRYGVVTKEEPAFSEIVRALSEGDEMQIESLDKDNARAGAQKDSDGNGLTAEDGVKSGILASLGSGAKWVMRIIQKWKREITYSLGGLIFFSLLGLGAVLFLVWKRKKRN